MKNFFHKTIKINRHKHVLFILVIVFIFLTIGAFAQTINKKNRILFLLDASSSMTYKWNEKETRFNAAARVMLSIMDSMYAQNNEVEFAVRTYGSDYASQDNNCTDTKLDVPFNLQNIDQIKTRLKYIIPLGSSPIAYSLQQAAENELNNTAEFDYSFVLITDGGESCNGNICETYQKLLANKVKIKPFIIGLDKNNILDGYYKCIGQYVNVATETDIADAVKMIIDANKTLLEKPTTLNLKTNYSNIELLKKDTIIHIEPKTISVKDNLNFILPIITKPLVINTNASINSKYLHQKNLIVPTYKEEIIASNNIDKIDIVSTRISKLNAVTNHPVLKKWQLQKTIIPKLDLEINNEAINNLEFTSFKILKNKNKFAILNPLLLKTQKLKIPPLEINNDTIKNILATNYRQVKNTVVFSKLNPIKFLKIPLPTLAPEVSIEVTEPLKTIFVIPVRNSFTYSTTRFAPSTILRTFKKITLPEYKYTEPKAIVKDKNKKPILPTENIADYKIKTDLQSNDTRVEVYFTDGTGKFYKTKPMIEFQNSISKKTEATIMRDVLPNGNPEPAKLDLDGVFDVVVRGTRDLTLKNVKIEKNKINQITVIVTDGTLIFTYRDDRNLEVPYKAVINRRFAAGATIVTMCKDERKFEPGTYYVEINTVPVRRYTTDISFGAITEIQIPNEGFMQVNNTEIFDNVEIFFEEGDQFAKCPECKITLDGNVENQKIKLLPGLYKLSYKKRSAPKFAAATIVDFQIFSNKTINLDLK